MNRQLNFRVWDIASKQFLDLKSGNWGHYYLTFDGKFMVPQQYLGIFDKKKREMCEGDIIAWSAGPMYEIVWDKTYARFHFPTITSQEGVYFLPKEEIRNSTICGNIFENPHLKEMNF